MYNKLPDATEKEFHKSFQKHMNNFLPGSDLTLKDNKTYCSHAVNLCWEFYCNMRLGSL